ncbi:pali-domain-containing protein, partial [Jaminaea rosea]
MNPATPGTILILVAAVLLAVCTASVPVNKSIYFLSVTAARRTVTFGCLGFCVGDQCSGTTVGYKLSDAGSLFGINGNIPYANQLSSSVLHGLSYTLVLHPVACGLSAVAFLLGILQHCTGFATAFLTSMVAGFATTVTLIALALDFALFTIAKKRVESDGGTASYGTAIWLTLAAFIVLVVAQCAVCCSCCAGR